MNDYLFEQLAKVLRGIEERLGNSEAALEKRDQHEAVEDDFIGARKASEVLKFSITTLYTKVCKREIPFYKQGNRLYFSRTELLAWIQEGKKSH